MATPFTDDGYTDQEADAIRQTLIEQHMKPGADWRGIFFAITTLMHDVHEGHAHPDTVLYPGTIQRRLRAVLTGLNQVKRALECMPLIGAGQPVKAFIGVNLTTGKLTSRRPGRAVPVGDGDAVIFPPGQ